MCLVGVRNTLYVTKTEELRLDSLHRQETGFLDCCAEQQGEKKKRNSLPSLTQKTLFSTPTQSKRHISQMIFLKTSRQALPPFSL